MDLSPGIRDRCAESGETVENRNANLEFGNLAVEVPCQEALAQQFDAVHLRFDATSAVVSTPSSLILPH
jgi:hypothetical protein